jgi:hypothetical protein
MSGIQDEEIKECLYRVLSNSFSKIQQMKDVCKIQSYIEELEKNTIKEI